MPASRAADADASHRRPRRRLHPTGMTTKMPYSSCPFDVIVVTSPDALAARAARELISSSFGAFVVNLPPPSDDLDDDGAGHDDGDDCGLRTTTTNAMTTPLFLSTCDPHGARLGSGGGTVAALAEADEAWHSHRRCSGLRRRHGRLDRPRGEGDDDDDDDDNHDGDDRAPSPTVLICHAGGESSRCPTQIALGKAWTSLPVLLPPRGGSTGTTMTTAGPAASSSFSSSSSSRAAAVVSNPTEMLVRSLSGAFAGVPRGSVVVAASDVLLSFGDECDESHDDGDDCERRRRIDFGGMDGVVGLAVPAPLSTAKNHGVFVLEPQAAGNDDDRRGGWRMSEVRGVLQKPSASEMRGATDPPCAFPRPRGDGNDDAAADDDDDDDELCAWIDTGVVAFLPGAARDLRELSAAPSGPMRLCTRRGLEDSYRERYGSVVAPPVGGRGGGEDIGAASSSSPPPSIGEFSRSTAPNICLYGEMLHALRTASSPAASTAPDLPYGALSRHELRVCAVPAGSFVHLGTTAELVDFVASGAAVSAARGEDPSSGGDADGKRWRHRRFGEAMGLTSRAGAFVAGFHHNGDRRNVGMNSAMSVKQWGYIGNSSIVEHCHIDADGINIGDGCVVSGVRGSASFCLFSGMCLQLLPLRRSWNASDPSLRDVAECMATAFVCICIDVHDNIKVAPAKTLFGMDLQFVLRCGIHEDDLWDESIPASKRMLWNAKILPVLSAGGDGTAELNYSFLDWIEYMWMLGGVRSDSSLDDTYLGPDPGTPSRAILGLKQWRESARLSPSQIRTVVDSEAEARYRSSIPVKKCEERRLSEVSDILMNRRHSSCNFDHVVDFVSSSNSSNGTVHLRWEIFGNAVQTLDRVASKAFTKGLFDVVGRTFMTMKLLIEDTVSDQVRLRSMLDSSDEGSKRSLDRREMMESMKESITILQLPQISEGATALVASIRDSILGGFTDPEMIPSCCDFLERAASTMTERCVSGSVIAKNPPSLERISPIPIGATACASAPARIDLAGGWSDTPPISFEYGGAVACIAVLVDGKRPLKAHCRMVKGDACIRLRTESRNLSDEKLLGSAEVIIRTLGDLANFSNPEADCSLLMCALIQLGFATPDSICSNSHTSIQSHLMSFCQSYQDDVGLEITAQSLLPTGSGMGSSSIIGGCILAAIAKCVGITLDGMGGAHDERVQINGTNSLIHSVLMLEQLLTTGGGWQDNIGGIVGGLKLGSSDANVLPLQTKVQRVSLPPQMIEELNKRLVLTFSGQPRLAKNILQQVLRRWATRSDEIMTTVEGLVKGASEAIACLEAGDLDGLGRVMNQYWKFKTAMAGPDSGAEPICVRTLIDLLSSKGHIVGATLCGAGGGGFLAMLASKGLSSQDIEATAKLSGALGLSSFTWHSCTISENGLVVDVINA